jgi:peptide/nickel transport system substrate-binding protein
MTNDYSAGGQSLPARQGEASRLRRSRITGGATRRRGQPGVAGLIVAAVLPLLAVACGGDDDETAASTNTPDVSVSDGTVSELTAPASTPGATTAESAPAGNGSEEVDPDARLTFTYPVGAATLDPHAETSQAMSEYWWPAYDTLTRAQLDGTVEPALAESWTYSEDGLSLALTIRDGVTFHDGTALDAAAVQASLDRARSGETSTQKGVLASITDVAATGPLEVMITTSRYDPTLPAVFGGASGAVVNPAAISAGTDLNSTTDGSGPFIITEHVPDTSATYDRVPGDHWDPAVGNLAGFTITAVPDAQIAANGLQSGQYDVSYLSGAATEANTLESAGLQRVTIESGQSFSLWINNQDPAFQDIRVRQAIAYAIDRNTIADTLFDGGNSCHAGSQMIPVAGNPLNIDGFDPYAYDPDKAEALIDEAGAAGTSFVLTDTATGGSTNVVQALQPMLNAVGLDVDVANGSPQTGLDYMQGKVAATVFARPPQAHPLMELGRYWFSGGAWHTAEGEDGELQAMLEPLADPNLAEAEVSSIYEDAAREIARLATNIPICSPVIDVMATDKVTDFEPSRYAPDARTYSASSD